MLTARKSFWFENLFAIYNKNLFKRRFHSLRVSGLAKIIESNSLQPLIIYANHSGWWDGLAAFEISRKAKLESFIMMEERQLKKLFLFRRLGAFSVVREKPREAVKSIEYAANLLKEKPNRALWIFPQGEILPNDARPIRFYNGLARIVEKVGDVRVVSATIRYEFLDDCKPEIFVKFGEIESFDKTNDFNTKKQTGNFAANLTENLDEIKARIISGQLADFENII